MNDRLDRLRAFARAALANDDTCGNERMFGFLRNAAEATDTSAAEIAIYKAVREIELLKVPGGSRAWLPHGTITEIAALAAEGLVPPLPHDARPCVVPGSWQFEGIEPGRRFVLNLPYVLDAFRDPDDRNRGVRQARCEITKIGSESTGRDPYAWFKDIDRPHEGQHCLPVGQFMSCMPTSVEPEPTAPSGHGRR
jgi:hypothetical protein